MYVTCCVLLLFNNYEPHLNYPNNAYVQDIFYAATARCQTITGMNEAGKA